MDVLPTIRLHCKYRATKSSEQIRGAEEVEFQNQYNLELTTPTSSEPKILDVAYMSRQNRQHGLFFWSARLAPVLDFRHWRGKSV